MSDTCVASAAIKRLLSVKTKSDLTAELERITHALGFERFAMGHHVDLVSPPGSVLRITNYQSDWIERSLGEGYFADDPVHQASTHTAAGFLWSSIADLIPLTLRQQRILEDAKAFGLYDGYTVPVHVPGEYRGTCSFGTRSAARQSRELLLAANICGLYAFEAGRGIARRGSGRIRATEVPKLTDRQRDALVLIGRGKADSEIGTLLGISKATAHEHVENVRRAYGNAQRPHLIARALFDGQISYADVLVANSPLSSMAR